MEVPPARRPLMLKIIKKTFSPLGAFIIGVVISLFLLPCSSGPYLTILGFLRAKGVDQRLRGYLYLVIYNLIFVAPMVVIACLVGLGYSSVEKLGALKNKYTQLIHLIVGLLMLGLSVYIIGTLYRR